MTQLHKARTSVPLTKASLAYLNKIEDFILFDVAPKRMVKNRSGKIYSYGKQGMRIVDSAFATLGRYNKASLTVEKSDHYFLQQYGLHGDVLNADLEAEDPIDAETDLSEMLLHMLILDAEKKLADVVTSTSNFTNKITLSGNDQWNEYAQADSDPFADLKVARDTVRAACGFVPNTISMGYNVYSALIDHPDVIARFPGASEITRSMLERKLQEVLGFEKLNVGKALYTDSNLGAATEALTDIWGNDCLVHYTEKNARLKSLTFAATYMRKGDPIETARIAAKDFLRGATIGEIYSTVVQKLEMDQVIVEETCAYLIKDAV